MKTDALAFGIAGIAFGLIAGWMIGTQYAPAPATAGAASASASAPAAAAPATPATPVLDQARVQALTAQAEQAPTNAAPRIELGNLYFDAERYPDAIRWYREAVALAPTDVNVSTDLGVSYYYSQRYDEALAQFDQSLRIDPSHLKTLLNQGIVRAFGKQDLQGAEASWSRVLAAAPDSPEAQSAKRALDAMKSAHAGGVSASTGRQ